MCERCFLPLVSFQSGWKDEQSCRCLACCETTWKRHTACGPSEAGPLLQVEGEACGRPGASVVAWEEGEENVRNTYSTFSVRATEDGRTDTASAPSVGIVLSPGQVCQCGLDRLSLEVAHLSAFGILS